MFTRVKIDFVFMAFCLFAMFLSCDSKYKGPMPAKELEKYQFCGLNADCVYVNNGCCDCANGGEETSINSDVLSEFLAEFNCNNVSCTLIARTPPCGSGTVNCDDGQCKYTL